MNFDGVTKLCSVVYCNRKSCLRIDQEGVSTIIYLPAENGSRERVHVIYGDERKDSLIYDFDELWSFE